MNEGLKKTIQIVVSAAIAIGMLAYIFSIVDINSMVVELQKADYKWILASIAISMVAHVARGLRWNLLLEPLGQKIRPINAIKSVLAGYLANYALPRAGEVVRCSIVKKTDDVPVNISLGTVITERIVDVAAMGLVFCLALVFEFNYLTKFLTDFFDSKAKGTDGNSNYIIYVLLLVASLGIAFVVVFIKNKEKFLKIGIVAKIYGFAEGLLQGILSITKMKNSWLFIFYTFLIWFSYYAMTYVILFSMADTASLPPASGLVILALASLGMAAPVQGGIGPYHLMVASALSIYGIVWEKGLILATILHTSQFVTMLVFGGISLVWVAFEKK